ncbi:MAG: ComEC/Rec2 family competence protein [Candidatus Microsaccharimonas sp.]
MWWYKRKVHVSWLVALICAGFVAGVALAMALHVSFVGAAMGLLCVVMAFFFRYMWVLPFAGVAAVIFGLGYGSAHFAERGAYARWFGKVVQVTGRVKEDPSKSPSGSYSVQLDSVEVNNQKQSGFLFVSTRSLNGMKRGDVISGAGQMKDGFGNFPASVSLTKITSIVRHDFGDVGRVVRDWFADSVRTLIPEPQASLGIGFLTGQKSALPEELSESLKIAGLTHIVVASGYNLTILVRMARKLLLKVSKYLSILSSSLMILAFMAVTGLSPSMTRAGLVSGLSLLSWYYGHVFHPFILLPIAAAITIALQPSYVWGDLGWQLSFSAFAGVMIVAPLLQAYFFGSKEPGVFRQILGETIAAHFVTVPIIALSFGTLSNVAIIANLLVVPLVPLAMLLTFICGLGAIFSVPFIEYVAVPTTWLLGYMTNVATFVSELSWAQSQVVLPGLAWAGYAAALAFACWWMRRKTGYNFQNGEILV